MILLRKERQGRLLRLFAERDDIGYRWGHAFVSVSFSITSEFRICRASEPVSPAGGTPFFCELRHPPDGFFKKQINYSSRVPSRTRVLCTKKASTPAILNAFESYNRGLHMNGAFLSLRTVDLFNYTAQGPHVLVDGLVALPA